MSRAGGDIFWIFNIAAFRLKDFAHWLLKMKGQRFPHFFKKKIPLHTGVKGALCSFKQEIQTQIFNIQKKYLR